MPTKNGVTYETLSDMAYAALPKIRAGIEQEQTYEGYPGVEELLPWLDSEGVKSLTYEEQIQLRQPKGTVVGHRPFADHDAVRDSYLAKQRVTMAVFIERSLVYDMLEEELSGEKDPEIALLPTLTNLVDAQQKALHDTLEYQLLGPGPTEKGVENGFLNFRYWAGMSVDGSGNFVEQATPGYVGTRTRFADGSVTSEFGDRLIDASLLANYNYRSLLWTHKKTIDEQFLKNWAESMEKQNFKRISKLKGRLQSPTWFCAFPTVLQAQVRDIANTQGADDGDVYKVRTAKIYGEVIRRAEILDQDPSLPCLAINKNAFKIKKAKNLWMKDLPKKRKGDSSYSYPLMYAMQGFASSRRRIGFVAHGSW